MRYYHFLLMSAIYVSPHTSTGVGLFLGAFLIVMAFIAFFVELEKP